MSHINVHIITERATRRIGRVEQVRALAPWPAKHDGDHWQLNRASGKPAHVPSGVVREPWPLMANQSLVLGVRGVTNATTTNTRTIPFACVVRDLVWHYHTETAAASAASLSTNDYGPIWHKDAESPNLTQQGAGLAVGVNNTYREDLRYVIPTPGITLTLSVTSPSTGDGYLSVIIQPLADYLKSLGV
jgi:hypothetical protein